MTNIWNDLRAETVSPPLPVAPPADNLANLQQMTARLALASAEWPTGAASLAGIVRTCQACGAAGVCRDWLARSPGLIGTAPAFCPNRDALNEAARRKTSAAMSRPR